MRKIKICIFEERFGRGGIETFIFNLCSNIDLNKFDITIVTINKVTNYFDNYLDNLGIKFKNLIIHEESNPIRRFQLGVPLFKKYLSENSFDIIHFNLSNSIDFLYVNIARKKSNSRIIIHSHNSGATSAIKYCAHYVGKLFFKYSNEIYLSCSDKAAKWLFSNKIYNNKKYLKIYNAVDINKYKFDNLKRQEIRRKYNWSQYTVVGHVGRFNVQKNHRFIIDIFLEYLKIKTDSILILVGEGETKEEIKRYACSKGIGEKVIFWGESDEVENLLQAFDLMLFPSLYEGMPYVLIEAQAASLPIIAADTITKEVDITQYLYFYSLSNEPCLWASKINALLLLNRDDTSNQMRCAGFDEVQTIKDLEILYKKVIGE